MIKPIIYFGIARMFQHFTALVDIVCDRVSDLCSFITFEEAELPQHRFINSND